MKVRSGIAFGVEIFLIFDMAIVHQLLRWHGVLLSDYFEYAVLTVSLPLAVWTVLLRNRLLGDPIFQHGLLMGVGGTLFVDVVLIDQMLKLHEVNYPASLNLGSGFIGLILVIVGIYGVQARKYGSSL